MKFRSKNLLVTGGAGFIGSNFIRYFLNKYDKVNVINLDLITYAGNLANTKSYNKNPRYSFIKGNICDKDLVKNIFEKYKIDGVINFAAETHVDNSILNPDTFVKTNVNGVFNLLNCAYNFWMNKPFEFKQGFDLARFHQISTDEVYGSIEFGSSLEGDSYRPNSPYSASKAAADMLVRSFNKTYGLNTTTTICSNNYGENQNEEKFIPKIISCLLSKSPIPVYGDGSNVRDWIHVLDHCKAVEVVFNESKTGEIYNVGGNNELSNLEIIDLIYTLLKKKYKIQKKINFIDDRFGHDKRYSLNCDKIRRELNWKSKSKLVLKNLLSNNNQ